MKPSVVSPIVESRYRARVDLLRAAGLCGLGAALSSFLPRRVADGAQLPAPDPRVGGFMRFVLRAVTVPLILTGTLVLGGGIAHAATYYVAKTGSDDNSCDAATSEATPKLTLRGPSGGISCLKAGDTLYVRAGTYEKIDNPNDGLIWASGTSWNDAITVAVHPADAGQVFVPSIGLGHNLGNPVRPQVSYWIFEGFNTSLLSLKMGVDHIRFARNNVDAGNYNAVEVFSTGEGLEIVENELHDASSACTEGDGNRWYGIYLNRTKNALIDGNRIYNMPGGGIQLYHGPGDIWAMNTVIRNNLIYNNNWCPLSNVGGIWLSHAEGTLIYNNVIYDNAVYHEAKWVGFGISAGLTTNTKVFNNTIYRNGASGINAGHALTKGLVVQNNIFWENRGPNFYRSEANDMVQDHNLCKESLCAITSSPEFRDVDAFDFHLQPGGPAVNKGINLFEQGVTTDFDGNRRSASGPFDLGAFAEVPKSPTGLAIQ